MTQSKSHDKRGTSSWTYTEGIKRVISCANTHKVERYAVPKEESYFNSLDKDFEPVWEPDPCQAPAGTSEKIIEMCRRIDCGEDLFHPEDAPPDPSRFVKVRSLVEIARAVDMFDRVGEAREEEDDKWVS